MFSFELITLGKVYICYIPRLKDEVQHLVINIYMSHILFAKGVKISVVCETNGRRERRQIAILTYNFWPQHTVLSSRPHLALLFLAQGYSTEGLAWAAAPSRAPSVTANWLCLRPSLANFSSHLLILFHHAYSFQLDHVIFFHLFTRCTSDWWLGQGSICNIPTYPPPQLWIK